MGQRRHRFANTYGSSGARRGCASFPTGYGSEYDPPILRLPEGVAVFRRYVDPTVQRRHLTVQRNHPDLLSRYVWDNVGTVLAHRLANVDSYEWAKKTVSGAVPLMADDLNDPVALRLPEDLALFRRYITSPDEKAIGVTWIDRVRDPNAAQ